MKYTVVLTEKRDCNVMVAVPGGTPWEWVGAFKDNPTWGKLFDEFSLTSFLQHGKKSLEGKPNG